MLRELERGEKRGGRGGERREGRGKERGEGEGRGERGGGGEGEEGKGERGGGGERREGRGRGEERGEGEGEGGRGGRGRRFSVIHYFCGLSGCPRFTSILGRAVLFHTLCNRQSRQTELHTKCALVVWWN